MKKILSLTVDDFEKNSLGRWLCVVKENSLCIEIDDAYGKKYNWSLVLNNVELCSDSCFLTQTSALMDLKSRIESIIEEIKEAL